MAVSVGPREALQTGPPRLFCLISVPDMKLNHLLELKGDVRETHQHLLRLGHRMGGNIWDTTLIVKNLNYEVRRRSGLSQLLSVCLS